MKNVQFPRNSIRAGCGMRGIPDEKHRIAPRRSTALQYAVERYCVDVLRLLLRHRPEVADAHQDEVNPSEFVEAAVTRSHRNGWRRRADVRYTGHWVTATRVRRGCCWIIVRSWRAGGMR
jgi:hypothetical protein